MAVDQALRIIYFILVKETEDKRSTSNNLFLHGPLIYMQWNNNYAFFCLGGSFQEIQIVCADLNQRCFGKCSTTIFEERLKADL